MSKANVRRNQLRAKYFVDRILACLALLALSPTLMLIAAIIKLDDRGPVFFVQERAGLDRSVFRIIKFRTMIPNADSFLDPDGRPTRDRLTRIGRFLRRWSLDELPQLLNVAMGHMSLVGPRPVPVEYADRMTSAQVARFSVRPGITGLAQVRGRHKQPWSQRIKWDIEYVHRVGLCLDLKIAVQTVRTVLDSETLVDRGDPSKVDIG